MFVPLISRAVRPLSEDAGRLGTRVRRGQPAKRWEEGIADAKSCVEYQRISGFLRFPTRRKVKQKFNVKEVATLRPHEVQRFDELREFPT